MSYVLKLCGWYPSKMDAFSGDFVQRHALAIATQIPVVAIFATKDNTRTEGGIQLEKFQEGQLTTIIGYYPEKKYLDKWWSQYYYLKIIRQLIPDLLLELGEPALVHVNIAWKAAIWMHYLRKKYGWPYVITENSTEYQHDAHLNIQEAPAIRQMLTRSLFKNCIRFIPVSHQLGHRVQQLFGSHIPFSVVRNAVDTKLFFPVPNSANIPFRLLHISTLTYQKNPEGLLSVFDNILAKYPQIEIVIVGPITPLLAKWKTINEHKGANITCTGMIPYAEVAAQLQAASVLVLFSRYENLPCVILEAHCVGLPVISTAVGGIDEIIDERNGLLVKEGDEKGLALAIETVLLGKKQFNNSGIAAAAHLLYNYEAIGKAFLNAYEDAGISMKHVFKNQK